MFLFNILFLLSNIIHNKHNSINYLSTKMILEYYPFNRLFFIFLHKKI